MPLRPLVLGHRGAPYAAPENTLAAHLAAIAEGADGVELDVHLTRDGVLAVHHDTVVGGVPVWTLSFADLCVAVGRPLATLEQILAAMPATATIFVEVKRQGAVIEGTIATRVLDAVRRRPGWAADPDRTVVGSFDPVLVQLFAALEPRVAPGLILDRRMLSTSEGFDPSSMPWLACVSMDVDLIDTPVARRCAAAGQMTLTWSVDGESPLRRCFDRFPTLHGVITKRPAQAVQVRG